jgi:hypothetical protein
MAVSCAGMNLAVAGLLLLRLAGAANSGGSSAAVGVEMVAVQVGDAEGQV